MDKKNRVEKGFVVIFILNVILKIWKFYLIICGVFKYDVFIKLFLKFDLECFVFCNFFKFIRKFRRICILGK